MVYIKIERLQKNICDTLKEWEIKIGYRQEEVQLYYPKESLLELLETAEENLEQQLEEFCKAVKRELGDIAIYETNEKGRYCVRIPAKGVSYVHEHIPESEFLKAFLKTVAAPGARLEDVSNVFYQFSDQVVIEKQEEREWGIFFVEEGIDPYVYYVEEDDFGLEYHRFTKEAYRRLNMESH